MACIEISLCLLFLVYLLYKWSTKAYKTFEERNVPHKKPLPLVGNAWPILSNKKGLHKLLIDLYRESKQHKIYGFYNFRDPIFIVNDPELVKKMGVKDFDSFTNHQLLFNVDEDPLLRGMLTVMKDQRWKDMRNTVTPVFTGAKMRTMFTLMNDCFDESLKYLRSQTKPGEIDFELDIKDCFCRLSNDLIATTAFGLKLNSYENRDNEFYTIGQAISKTRGKQALKFVLFSIAPYIMNLLGLKIFDSEKTDYFVRLVVEAMKYREENNIVRPDIIQLLMEAKRESTQKWADEDIVAQCFIFFFAAFENNANLLCTTCYELADNPEVQEKLYEEILRTYENLDGRTIDYDALQEMKYMDTVVQESLRKWSLAAFTDRVCGKDYKVIDDDDGSFICELKQGDKIWFHTLAFHWDEEYFEHPEIFDPERFSDENKHKIKPFTYLPFGVGPRNCIGNRYALMQAKAMLYYLLKDFVVKRSEKMCKNLMDDLSGFTIVPKSGFWFRLQKRE